jgi:hypothetical protein
MPDELKGKLVVMHFWSAACPPDVLPSVARHGPSDMTPDSTYDLAVVGVNLDTSREEVEAFLKDKGKCKGWIHVFSGKGWDDPLARELDVYGLPRSVLLDREGGLYRWGYPGQLGDSIYRAVTFPGAGAGVSPRHAKPMLEAPELLPSDRLSKQVALDLGSRAAMTMVLVPSGQFKMGSSIAQKRHFDDETPLRMVFITRPFYMGLHHVTRGQFAVFVEASGYQTEAEREGWSLLWDGARWNKAEGASWRKPGFEQDDDHPVVCVSWNDAVEFCKWLSRKSGAWSSRARCRAKPWPG